eukprot:TRINITY_DN3449_c0_g1_i5.p1 TRINITY_DN3449_c0_g1~~TRINITY_DN3449_c0_g1_i5.p1  ORF type:complete len:182 (-),score=24.22 TRINITY_DN3449_c0_g1_i5:42-587(-)
MVGFAIGGLSGGESKDSFWRIVAQCAQGLPEDKPRYLMGVGYPLDLVVCVCLGVDMFDCVYPSRTARFGTVFVRSGTLNLKNKHFEHDMKPIDPDCSCNVCKHYTRAYLHTIAAKDQLASQLLTYHNISYLKFLMEDIRKAIIEGTLSDFVVKFMELQFPKKDYPTWAVEALESVGIVLPK